MQDPLIVVQTGVNFRKLRAFVMQRSAELNTSSKARPEVTFNDVQVYSWDMLSNLRNESPVISPSTRQIHWSSGPDNRHTARADTVMGPSTKR